MKDRELTSGQLALILLGIAVAGFGYAFWDRIAGIFSWLWLALS